MSIPEAVSIMISKCLRQFAHVVGCFFLMLIVGICAAMLWKSWPSAEQIARQEAAARRNYRDEQLPRDAKVLEDMGNGWLLIDIRGEQFLGNTYDLKNLVPYKP